MPSTTSTSTELTPSSWTRKVRTDSGMSAFTDTVEREKTVDFVTYFSAGIQWAQKPGAGIDPNNAAVNVHPSVGSVAAHELPEFDIWPLSRRLVDKYVPPAGRDAFFANMQTEPSKTTGQ